MTYFIIEYAASGDNEVPGEFVTGQELASGTAASAFDPRTAIIEISHDGDGVGFVRLSAGASTPAAPTAGSRIPIYGKQPRFFGLFNRDTPGRVYDRLAVADS